MSVGRWLQDDNKESIQPNRNRIYQHIVDNPGCHLRKIRKDLKLAVGDTQYHLQILEKTSLIKSRRMGIFRVYYAASVLEQRQESILAVLRQEVPRDIILFLLEHPGSTQGEIARHKDFTAPTINWHMSRLIEIGLIRSKKEGKFVNYYVEGNVRDITINYFKERCCLPSLK
jgi:predicted transcriptional regulator